MYTYGHHERQYGAGHAHSVPVKLPYLFGFIPVQGQLHTQRKETFHD